MKVQLRTITFRAWFRRGKQPVAYWKGKSSDAKSFLSSKAIEVANNGAQHLQALLMNEFSDRNEDARVIQIDW